MVLDEQLQCVLVCCLSLHIVAALCMPQLHGSPLHGSALHAAFHAMQLLHMLLQHTVLVLRIIDLYVIGTCHI